MVTARELVDQASAILLDFDGPVCSVFARLPAAKVAEDMRARLASFDPALDLEDTGDDPLDVLRTARNHSPETGAAAEDLLAAAELEAVKGAQPTEGAAEFLRAMRKRGTPVGIVSNNGEQAIRAYLALHALSPLVAAMSARDPADARWMKPDPRPLAVAMRRLDSTPSSSVMIGDSISDLSASRATGVRVIALANKEGKAQLFLAADADAVIRTMHELTE